MAFIEVRNLAVEFTRIDEEGREVPGKRALNGVDLDIEKESFVAVVGMNGSGKSTFAKCLNGLIVPTEGDVTVDGMNTRDESKLWDIRSRVGMVFQTPNPLPVSVRRNITLPLELTLGLSRAQAEETMRESLTAAGLWDEVSDRLDASALNLSGGQQQRLCLARALALKPDLLLLDEPTASLDQTAAQNVESLILALKEKVSVIMVSHSLQQASRLADHAVIMADGCVKRTCDSLGLKTALEDGSLIREAF